MSARSSSKVRKAWMRWAQQIALFALIFVGVQCWQTRNAVKGAAPALEGVGLDGPVSLSSVQGPVAVHFWATWCGVCRAEEGNVESFSKGHRLVSVAVSSGSDDDVRAYRTKSHLTFETLNDPDGRVAAAWGVSAFPTTFFLDREGRVRTVSVGYTTSLGLRARLWWASLFG